jgi:hypothetical protein
MEKDLSEGEAFVVLLVLVDCFGVLEPPTFTQVHLDKKIMCYVRLSAVLW